MTWTVDVPVKVDTVQPATPKIRTMTLVLTDSVTPNSATVLVGVHDAEENWLPHVAVDPLRLSDAEPPSRTPEAGVYGQQDASDFLDAIMTSTIDNQCRMAKRFNIARGTKLSEALPQIAWQLLYPPPVSAELAAEEPEEKK